ncbi:MAG: hypothetical protein WC916_06120 [Candidatus Woesearchaeota archaeon]
MITTNIDNKKVYITEDLIKHLVVKEQRRQKTKAFIPVTTEMINAFLLKNFTRLFNYDDTISIVKPTSRRAQNGGPEVDDYYTKEKEFFHLNSLITESLVKTYHVNKKDNLEDKTIGMYTLPTGKCSKLVVGVYAKN